MDAIDMMRAAVLSPVAMLIVAAMVVALAKARGQAKPRVSTLIWITVALAIGGAAASLAYTIGWMVWYEKSTGYSAGNAPLGWIFFYGPASAAIGQLVALIIWWFKKPRWSKCGLTARC
jgi:hypothetical protein